MLIALGWFSAVLLAPINVRANETLTEETLNPPSIYISEIAWAGSSLSNADEWIELVNLETESVDISGWILIGSGSNGSNLTLPNEAVIEPNSTYLISNYDQENKKSVLGVTPNFVSTSISLSNSSLGITLSDEFGTIVDSAGDGGPPAAGSSGQYKSMTRISTDDGTLASSWSDATESNGFDPEAIELGTPGTSNLGEQPFAPTDDNSNDQKPYDPDPTDPSEESEESESEDGDDPSGTDSTDSSEDETNEILPITHPTGTLIINEFVCDPSEGGEEWIEIWNPYNNVINLAGWTVQDGSGAKTNLPDQLLGLHQFVLVTAPKGKLNNNGDTITLFDPTDAVIDEIMYGTDSIPAADDPNSAARADDGTWSETETPTPGWVNEITTTIDPEPDPEPEIDVPQATSDEPLNSSTASSPKEELEGLEDQEGWEGSYDLRLLALYPNTSQGDATSEFISITNTGTEPIELDGWQLADASKGYDLPNISIDPDESLTFYRTDTNLALNNSGGETVSIIAPNGVITDQLTYEKTKKGFELILGTGGWAWQNTALGNESETTSTDETSTNLPTEPINMALAPNPVEEIEPTATKSSSSIFESSLDEVRAMARGTEVRVTGTVSVEPGVLGKQVMYLAGSGIQIYFYRADWPELNRGDTVTVTGELVESYNETRIKLSSADDLSIIGHTKGPVAHKMSLAKISEETEGWLVSVTGMIQSIENDRFILEDGNSTLKVIIKEETEIDLAKYNIGDQVEITGIVTQYIDEYRLLPRDAEDLKQTEPKPTGLAGLSTKEQAQGRRGLYAVSLATTVGIILLVLIIKYRARLQSTNNKPQNINYNLTS